MYHGQEYRPGTSRLYVSASQLVAYCLSDYQGQVSSFTLVILEEAGQFPRVQGQY